MLYAKSNPIESIGEHTDNLLKEFYTFEKLYGAKIKGFNEIRDLIYYSIIYHDIGKAFTPFQNRIKKNIGIEFKESNLKDIPHNYVSLVFIPMMDLNINNKDNEKVIFQSVAFHHEREPVRTSEEIKDIKEAILDDIGARVNEISSQIKIEGKEILLKNDISKGISKRLNNILFVNRIKLVDGKEELYYKYILVKGLLHRFDHAASAHVPVEEESRQELDRLAEYSITSQGFDLRDVQKYTKENSDKSIIIIASTGIGKTESALLWTKDDKAFFTLPLRVSLNALYKRVHSENGNIKYNSVGLIHSTAKEYVENGDEDFGGNYDKSLELSKKLIFCTIDQILKIPFLYTGYEKFYATFAYTKIIIDEIQAYSPECAAVIIKALQMINDIGGKFLVMTATLPKIYTEELKKRGINIEVKSFLSDAIRHKISLKDKDIEEDVDFIKECGKTKKILVIVNTVNKAIEMYDKLKDKNLDVNLLHSRFIQEDRANKERDVLKFALNDKNRDKTPGIWVTTQIVEASLDVDFDMLFTENSSLDSLFQRFGRCFRSRIYSDSSGLANVFVYKKASGIGYIYDKEIAEKSYEMLLEFDDKTIDEKAKVEMVDRLYSRKNLKDTDYLKDFNNGLSFLDNMIDYDISSKEAQKLLRDVDNYTVIPKDLYDKNFKLFEDYNDLTKEWEKATKDRKDEIKKRKYELLTDIKKLTISIMSKQVDNAVKNDNRITFVPDLSGFYYVIGANYTSEYGLIFNGKNMNID